MKFYNLASLALIALSLVACNGGKELPKGTVFNEPDAPNAPSSVQEWDKLAQGVNVSWGSSYERYNRDCIPQVTPSEELNLTAWKNERLSAQLVLWTKDSINNLQIKITDLKSESGVVNSDAVKCFYVRNVLADEFLGGCGHKEKKNETAHLVPDCLEEFSSMYVSAKSTRGYWLSINLPSDASAGEYSGEVQIMTDGKTVQTLRLNVNVLNRELPSPQNWSYHLDLWQNPYAVARYHGLELWSAEHFEKMKPLYRMLANAGQKCITTTVVNRAWGGQTYDEFGSMVKHTLKKDGTWAFDYNVFDKWVEFAISLGIKEQINCYSLIPWGNQLWYFDEATSKDTFIEANASSKEYAQYWTPFLEDFSKHLKDKGWFDISSIAMDERPLEDMKHAVDLINAHSGLKITSAANYNPGISGNIYDLSVESKHMLPAEVLKQRKDNGKKTTFYVCCSAEYPNNFTFSPPAEGVWQGWYSYAKDLDGFLRWAYNSWVEEPMQDTRFKTWPAGDTFFAYPDAKSSVRFEALREGIQDYEKLRILVQELSKSSEAEDIAKQEAIKALLSEFEVSKLGEDGALEVIVKGKTLLNRARL
ncbi:MAG: DUF4091 domain-containing protein [Bacteroidales bacterium]